MNFSTKITLLAIVFIIPAVSSAFFDNPPDGFAGDPPMATTCVQCHDSFDLDSGQGTLELTGLPELYSPGETYILTVSLSDTGASRWGMEITALFDDDWRAGEFILINEEYNQLSGGDPPERQYLKHTRAGTFAGQEEGAEWEFEWVAPDEDIGEIAFYMTGNAANNDTTAEGDHIYSYSVRLEAEEDVVKPTDRSGLTTGFTLAKLFPNPFNAEARMIFTLDRYSRINMSILNSEGRLVQNLPAGFYSPGTHNVTINAQDLPAGLYMFYMEIEGKVQVKKMIILK